MTYIEKIADALARAFRAGRLSRANAGIAARGQRPRTLGVIGQGSEGIAQERTHPRFGTQVAKIYDRQGSIYSDDVFDLKTRKFKQLNMLAPNQSAKLYGIDKTRRIHFVEHVEDNGYSIPQSQVDDLSEKFDISDISSRKDGNVNIISGKIVDFTPRDPKVQGTTYMGRNHRYLRNIYDYTTKMEDGIIPVNQEKYLKAKRRNMAIIDKLSDKSRALEREQTPKKRIDRVLRQAYGEK